MKKKDGIQLVLDSNSKTTEGLLSTTDRHRKLRTWEVIQFNLHLKYQKVLFITF